MKKAPRYWYDAMDKFFVEKKLAEHPELEEKYSTNYSSFKRFCYLVMQYYGWQDIEQLQKEFDNETFFNIKFKRMYQTNAKKWKKISQEVFERDAYTCKYCGKIGGILEVDHVIPFSKGGSDELDNLVCACRKCNRQKKDKTLEEFEQWRKKHE
ncbi:HNH endonuclease [Enterococcus faecalis]|uniref:HNH endonuclease n=1 Tax=Enterococcus faecalis TaxID=1351 RepID=UPI001F599907|nr:HNH endonuclease [Enterococcus faecalis]